MGSTDLVLKLIQALERAGAGYMLVGSYSSNYYGEPRATKDADFVVVISPEQLSRIAAQIGPELVFDQQMAFETA